MLIKLLTQCLAPPKYFSDVYCYCFLCSVTEPNVCESFSTVEWNIILESVDHLLSVFKMVSLERMQEVWPLRIVFLRGCQ